jgi:hypothetical protein
MNLTQVEKRHGWQKIINQHESSNQSAVDFCRDNDLRIGTFYYWKKKFANEEQPIAEFKELTIPVTEGAGLWFDFGNSARLVIDNDFNQATFKKLMGTLLEC